MAHAHAHAPSPRYVKVSRSLPTSTAWPVDEMSRQEGSGSILPPLLPPSRVVRCACVPPAQGGGAQHLWCRWRRLPAGASCVFAVPALLCLLTVLAVLHEGKCADTERGCTCMRGRGQGRVRSPVQACVRACAMLHTHVWNPVCAHACLCAHVHARVCACAHVAGTRVEPYTPSQQLTGVLQAPRHTRGPLMQRSTHTRQACARARGRTRAMPSPHLSSLMSSIRGPADPGAQRLDHSPSTP